MGRRRSSGWLAVASLAGAAALAGCSDLSEFRGRFEGQVVGDEVDSFIRRGFAPGTRLSLEFDPAFAQSTEPPPGRLTTSDGRFVDTPLAFIAPLQHDTLSLYDFPGAGRLENYIFHARSLELGPEAPARDVLVFVSLTERERVEVRIMVGAGSAPGDLYGFWTLSRP